MSTFNFTNFLPEPVLQISTEFFSDPVVQVWITIVAALASALLVILILKFGVVFMVRRVLWIGFWVAVYVLNFCVVVCFFLIDIISYTYETYYKVKIDQEDTLLIYLLIHFYFALWRCTNYRNWELQLCEIMISISVFSLLAYCKSMNEDTINEYKIWVKDSACQIAGNYVYNCPVVYDYSIGFVLNQWQKRWIIYCLDNMWYFEVQAVTLTFIWITIKNVKSVVWFCLFFWYRK